MKISICVPQYNRIQYLLRSLEIISLQSYENIEVIISDDCSTDNTEVLVKNLIPNFKYPIVYHKNEINRGYDYNYRNCIALANGEYAFVIGNDDSINGVNSISKLVEFLIKNKLPDIGYCNMLEESTGGTIIKRALSTKIIGSGVDVALKNYSCFSFVGGLIYKKDTFDKYNSSKYDGSIYAQMYLGVVMIASGAKLFSIAEPFVLKDIVLTKEHRNSYKDTIARSWKNFKIVNGGLPSVINVLIAAIRDSGDFSKQRVYLIFKRIYLITFPHWIIDYKENGAFPESIGLIIGLWPIKNKNFREISFTAKLKLLTIYFFSAIVAVLLPLFIYKSLKQRAYTYLKK
jgi:glycosyltransferase involved in cell wall biosynthesis